MEPIKLDRVQQRCKHCADTHTHIVAAGLSLTRIYFETCCPRCGWTSTTLFDLLLADQWLQGPRDAALPNGYQQVGFSPALCDHTLLRDEQASQMQKSAFG